MLVGCGAILGALQPRKPRIKIRAREGVVTTHQLLKVVICHTEYNVDY